MYITDNSTIVSAKPLHPEWMADNAESLLINLFKTMRDKEHELTDARMKVHELENEVKQVQDLWNHQSSLFDITYAKKEIQDIKQTSYLGIINPTDYRNK